MNGSRLLLIVAAILFILAALDASGTLHLASAEVLALFGFAAWSGSGAV